MTIGELILNLGIKGTEKTVGALTNVTKGLKDTASLSLEAKAGILGAMYALEQLFAASGKTGTNLTNFNALMGVSAQTLQQYQYAARQVGVTNEETESSFKALQSAATKTLMGEGGPKGLARVSLLTGGISPKDMETFAKQPQVLLQKLQEYAKKETNIGLRNETLKSFGLGENMIAGLSRNAFRPEVLKKAPTYSDGEVKQLDRANIAWSNLGTQISMAVGHFNAMHGGQLVSDISKIVTQVMKLLELFVKLSEKLHVFELIGKAFEGWGMILGGVTSAVDAITGAVNDPKKKKQLVSDTVKGGKEALGVAGFLGKSLFQGYSGALYGMTKPAAPANAIQNKMGQLAAPLGKQAAAPQMGATKVTGNTQTNSVNINNNFQHPGTDHKKTGESVKRSVENAYRQLSSQAQGT